MIKKIIFISFLASLILSCSSETVKVKEPVVKINQSEFVSLLIDVNLLEGHLTNLNVNQVDIRDLSLGQYKTVFEKHNLNYNQYKENYDYYIQQDNYKDILQIVYDSLDSLSVRYENIEAYKEISFIQYKDLLGADSLAYFLQNDTILNHNQKIDTIINFYRNNPEKIKAIKIDSTTFEKNILKLRKNKLLFKSVMNQIYNK
jgi:hypothetical protein